MRIDPEGTAASLDLQPPWFLALLVARSRPCFTVGLILSSQAARVSAILTKVGLHPAWPPFGRNA
jgi:hypothetical protein